MSQIKLTFLGTGAAMVKDHYQASFVLETQTNKMLVDTMGGYDILRAIHSNDVEFFSITSVFVSHKHLDHSLGFPWIVRRIYQSARIDQIPGGYKLKVLLSKDLKERLIQTVTQMNHAQFEIAEPYIEFIEIDDIKETKLNSAIFIPLDLKSKKDEQFGFILEEDNLKLSFTGDEPLREEHIELTTNSDVLIHEAFCLAKDEQRYGAHAKNHSTALEAAQYASTIAAKNLILSHIADEEPNRKERLTEEAVSKFPGTVYTPEDGETIVIGV